MTKYQTSEIKVTVEHNICGHTYSVKPSHIVDGHGCPVCAEKVKGKKRKTNEVFLRELEDIHGNQYDVIKGYVRYKDPILLKHRKCGYTYKTTPGTLLAGKGCPKCGAIKRSEGRIKYTHDEMRAIIENCGQYRLLTKYTKTESPVKIEHLECGNIYTVKPVKFLLGQRCPRCSKSAGENRIREYLTREGYTYEQQYRFNDCKNERPLPFDFAIFDGNDLRLLVEFNGGQHYKPIAYFGGEDGFKNRKRNDKIKKDYCDENGYCLIIIPFWEEDSIPSILSKAITQ